MTRDSLPVKADFSYDFKFTILETDQRKNFTLHCVSWDEQEKYL